MNKHGTIRSDFYFYGTVCFRSIQQQFPSSRVGGSCGTTARCTTTTTHIRHEANAEEAKEEGSRGHAL
eukprot:3871056-Amphidinium_carterae.1